MMAGALLVGCRLANDETFPVGLEDEADEIGAEEEGAADVIGVGLEQFADVGLTHDLRPGIAAGSHQTEGAGDFAPQLAFVHARAGSRGFRLRQAEGPGLCALVFGFEPFLREVIAPWFGGFSRRAGLERDGVAALGVAQRSCPVGGIAPAANLDSLALGGFVCPNSPLTKSSSAEFRVVVEA